MSNESNEHVYFDNLQVSHVRGRIVEEDHYYAYGLKIAAISSRKLADPNEGHVNNKNLYNDKELFDDAELGWYDYGFRNYDAQIGRFPQLDPLTDGYPYYTPYQYAGCEPIANVDVDGLEPAGVVNGTVGVVTKASEMAGVAVFSTARIIPMAAKVGPQSLMTLLTFGNFAVNAVSASVVIDKNINQKKAGLDGINITYIKPTPPKPKSGPNWLERISTGKGSTQPDGFTFSGNGNGTSEFKDHGTNNSGSVDMGSMWEVANMFRGDAAASFMPYRPRPIVERVIKFVEFHYTIGESTYKISEETQASNVERLSPIIVIKKPVKGSSLWPDTLNSSKISSDEKYPDTIFLTPVIKN